MVATSPAFDTFAQAEFGRPTWVVQPHDQGRLRLYFSEDKGNRLQLLEGFLQQFTPRQICTSMDPLLSLTVGMTQTVGSHGFFCETVSEADIAQLAREFRDRVDHAIRTTGRVDQSILNEFSSSYPREGRFIIYAKAENVDIYWKKILESLCCCQEPDEFIARVSLQPPKPDVYEEKAQKPQKPVHVINIFIRDYLNINLCKRVWSSLKEVVNTKQAIPLKPSIYDLAGLTYKNKYGLRTSISLEQSLPSEEFEDFEGAMAALNLNDGDTNRHMQTRGKRFKPKEGCLTARNLFGIHYMEGHPMTDAAGFSKVWNELPAEEKKKWKEIETVRRREERNRAKRAVSREYFEGDSTQIKPR